MTSSVSVQHRGEFVVPQPLRSVMDVDPQCRSECRRLVLPVSHHRHRADQQRRRRPWVVGVFPGLQREHLDRLAQAHVVGEAGAEPDAGHEGQVVEPALLVGPKGRQEVVGRGDGPQLFAGPPGQQGAEPALRGYRVDRHRRVESDVVPGREVQHLTGGHPAGSLAAQEVQAAPQLVRVRRDPLPADPDQRTLGIGQRLEFGLAQHLVADGQLPAEVDELVTAETGAALDDTLDRGARGEPQGESMSTAPPRRQLQADAGRVQLRRGIGQKPVRANGIGVPMRRARFIQRLLQLGIDAAGAAEFGQQQVLRLIEPAIKTGSAAPDLVGGDLQARVRQRLQQEFQPPARLLVV